MLQTGDVGLVSLLKGIMLNVVFLVLAPLLVRLTLLVGLGFVAWSGASSASTLLPAFSFQIPILMAVLLALIFYSTISRSLIVPMILLFVIGLIVSVIWVALPTLTLAWSCFTGSIFCQTGRALVIVFDFILTVVITLGLLFSFFGSVQFAFAYWQREYYLTTNSDYQAVTFAGNYDPNYDPEADSEEFESGEQQQEMDEVEPYTVSPPKFWPAALDPHARAQRKQRDRQKRKAAKRAQNETEDLEEDSGEAVPDVNVNQTADVQSSMARRHTKY